jgi:hypothetical protein
MLEPRDCAVTPFKAQYAFWTDAAAISGHCAKPSSWHLARNDLQNGIAFIPSCSHVKMCTISDNDTFRLLKNAGDVDYQLFTTKVDLKPYYSCITGRRSGIASRHPEIKRRIFI